MLGFMQFLGAGEAVQRNEYLESHPGTGINSTPRAVVEVLILMIT